MLRAPACGIMFVPHIMPPAPQEFRRDAPVYGVSPRMVTYILTRPEFRAGLAHGETLAIRVCGRGLSCDVCVFRLGPWVSICYLIVRHPHGGRQGHTLRR